jgi:hypothetical protein
MPPAASAGILSRYAPVFRCATCDHSPFRTL